MTPTVAITGSSGFIGTHLTSALERIDSHVPMRLLDHEAFHTPRLRSAVEDADVLVHLAGVNRGSDEAVYEGNVGIARRLAGALEAVDDPPPVIFASSTQRRRDNAYGRSKRAAEELLATSLGNAAPLTVLEIPNVFGPGCRPFYNSVVATFCHQLTHEDSEPELRTDAELELIWITDLVDTITNQILEGPPGGPTRPGPCEREYVSGVLGRLRRLRAVHFDHRRVPALRDRLDGLLYRMLVTYADPSDRRYAPALHTDDRGRLFEIVKQHKSGGQAFFSSTAPHIERGNHYHTRKFEKFCVVEGEAVIKLRRVGTEDVQIYRVTGRTPEIVDIPLFHAHSIENVGEGPLLTLFWASEVFDEDDPDTFAAHVVRESR